MNFNPSKAIELQKAMQARVAVKPLDPNSVETIAGLDVGYRKNRGLAVAVLVDSRNLKPLCQVAVVSDVNVPYIPGLLAFREAPVMIAAYYELVEQCEEPDVIMVNGHGLAHPRKLGIATHIGLALAKPTIGIAKKKLYGEVVELSEELAELRVEGVKVGYVVRRTHGTTYVSVGHLVDPDSALNIAFKVWKKDRRFPEPIHLADKISHDIAKKL